MSSGKIEKLARMADQIGSAFAAEGGTRAAEDAATHIEKFWTPKMIRELVAEVDAGGAKLNPTATAAVQVLKTSLMTA